MCPLLAQMHERNGAWAVLAWARDILEATALHASALLCGGAVEEERSALKRSERHCLQLPAMLGNVVFWRPHGTARAYVTC